MTSLQSCFGCHLKRLPSGGCRDHHYHCMMLLLLAIWIELVLKAYAGRKLHSTSPLDWSRCASELRLRDLIFPVILAAFTGPLTLLLVSFQTMK